MRTQQAVIDHAQGRPGRTPSWTYDRAKELFKDKLLAKQDYDAKKADYDAAVAALNEAADAPGAGPLAARADRGATGFGAAPRGAGQSQCWRSTRDMLQKYDSYAPLDGVVTNLPVREGETVVPGVQNSAGSTIMTIADMSLITAEVKVDETDIVNVAAGPGGRDHHRRHSQQDLQGHVTEIGDTAILRSTGLAASQSAISSQEAKDFKVVIAMDNPPDEIRPGLSCTAKITTATRQNALTIPIQALTVRQKGDLEAEARHRRRRAGGRQARSRPRRRPRKEEVQGVFVVDGRQGRVPQGGDRHHRRHRYRSAERPEGGRPDRHRQLPGDPHHCATTPR